MPDATLTSKGQVTVPKSIRDRLGLEAGDTLVFSVDETGSVVVRPGPHGEGVIGSLRDFATEHPVSVQEMKAAVRKRARRGAASGNS